MDGKDYKNMYFVGVRDCAHTIKWLSSHVSYESSDPHRPIRMRYCDSMDPRGDYPNLIQTVKRTIQSIKVLHLNPIC